MLMRMLVILVRSDVFEGKHTVPETYTVGSPNFILHVHEHLEKSDVKNIY